MSYNIYFDISAIIVSIFTLLFVFCKKNWSNNQTKIFALLILCSVLSSLFDTFGALFNEHPDSLSLGFGYFLNIAYLVF